MVDVATPSSKPETRPAAPRPSASTAGAAIGIVGALVLLDVAFETFRSVSPFRWWAIGAAAVYLVAAAATLRSRIAWRLSLAIFLTAFLGLLTATAWLPGGLNDGIRMFGQPTVRLLSAVSAAALVMAAIVLVQATALPLVLRLGATLLALYGAGAFALASWQLTPYGALFAGASEWHALPRLLQGAIVGGLLALPISLVVAGFGGLSRGTRSWKPDAIVALALTFAMVVSGFMNADGSLRSSIQTAANAATPNGAVDVPERPTPLDAATSADAVALVKQIASAPLPAAFDVDKKAAEIGSDPAALFGYVHDHVRTEIYSGVLRGARGTLMGGAGNAWDQALLLASMLRHHGREARFARVRLTPDASAKIVDRMFADAARPRPATASPVVQVPESVQAVARRTLARVQTTSRRAQSDLLKAIDRAHLTLGDSSTTEQQLASEAADHVYVEYRDGDRWVALDPVGASSPGASIALSTETLTDVPDAAQHHVTIRVMVEQRRDQQLETKEVLRYATTAAAINGARVALFNNIDHELTSRWRAMPILLVDGTAYGALRFTDAGVESVSAKDADLIGQAHSAVGQLGRVTDLFSSDQPAQQKPAAAQLTGVWMEFAFADPGGREDVVRRPVLDRIGVGARAARQGATAPLAPVREVAGAPVEITGVYSCSFASGPLDPSWPTRQLSSVAPALAAPGFSALPDELWSAAASIHVGSQQLVMRVRPAGSQPIVFYEATPRLAIASLEFTPGSAANSAIASFAVDLRRNIVRAAGRRVAARELVAGNVARGVLDGAIEDAVAAIAAGATPVASTVGLMLNADRERVDVVASSDRAAVAGLAIPDDAKTRLGDSVAQGHIVVVAKQPIRIGTSTRVAWWDVEPATGETLGVLDNGLHGGQPMVERGNIHANVDLPFAKTLAVTPPPVPPGITITITITQTEILGFVAGFVAAIVAGVFALGLSN